MASVERITVTLPAEIVRDIDRLEKNRSKFVQEAVRRELDLRRRAELHRSLSNPHPESGSLLEEGFSEWVDRLPDEQVGELVDMNAGKPVRWIAGEGWVEG
jgi:hypothetical protein